MSLMKIKRLIRVETEVSLDCAFPWLVEKGCDWGGVWGGFAQEFECYRAVSFLNCKFCLLNQEERTESC